MLHHPNGLSRAKHKAIPRNAADKRAHSLGRRASCPSGGHTPLGRWASRPSEGRTRIRATTHAAIFQQSLKEKTPPRNLHPGPSSTPKWIRINRDEEDTHTCRALPGKSSDRTNGSIAGSP